MVFKKGNFVEMDVIQDEEKKNYYAVMIYTDNNSSDLYNECLSCLEKLSKYFRVAIQKGKFSTMIIVLNQEQEQAFTKAVKDTIDFLKTWYK